MCRGALSEAGASECRLVAPATSGATRTTVEQDRDRVAELDGYHSVAIVLVVALHLVIRPNYSLLENLLGTAEARLLDMAWCGADIFFALSGLLVGGIFFDQRNSMYFYRAFYSRRTARIFPVYFLLADRPSEIGITNRRQGKITWFKQADVRSRRRIRCARDLTPVAWIRTAPTMATFGVGAVATVLAAVFHWLTLRRARLNEAPVPGVWPLSVTLALLLAVLGLVSLGLVLQNGPVRVGP